MTGRQWGYLLSTCLISAAGVLVVADLDGLTWDMIRQPKFIIGMIMAVSVAVNNYFKER
jgi:hypothetical protein